MLGREAVGDGKRPHAPCPPRFGHHPAVAQNRTRAIASAVKKHQHAGCVAAGRDRRSARHAVEIDRHELHVVSDRPNGTDLFNAAAAFLPAHRPRLGAEKTANGVDFALAHRRSFPVKRHKLTAARGGLKPAGPPSARKAGASQGAPQALSLKSGAWACVSPLRRQSRRRSTAAPRWRALQTSRRCARARPRPRPRAPARRPPPATS